MGAFRTAIARRRNDLLKEQQAAGNTGVRLRDIQLGNDELQQIANQFNTPVSFESNSQAAPPQPQPQPQPQAQQTSKAANPEAYYTAAAAAHRRDVQARLDSAARDRQTLLDNAARDRQALLDAHSARFRASQPRLQSVKSNSLKSSSYIPMDLQIAKTHLADVLSEQMRSGYVDYGQAAGLMARAARENNKPWITVGGLTRAAVGAGAGALAGTVAAKGIGMFMNITPKEQKFMQGTGAALGTLINLGKLGL